MGAVDLKDMRKMAERLRDDEPFGECYSTADMLDAAAAELAEHRRAPTATGPSVAERLVAYRAAILSNPDGGHVFAEIENDAHAMLRAEREPEGVSRG